MATGPQIRGNGGDHRVGLAVDGRVNRPVGITGVRRQRPHRAGSGRRDGHPRAHNRHKGRMLTAGARPGKPVKGQKRGDGTQNDWPVSDQGLIWKVYYPFPAECCYMIAMFFAKTRDFNAVKFWLLVFRSAPCPPSRRERAPEARGGP